MVGYRTLDVPETVHRGMPSAMLTFIVSLDDGVEAGDTADALAVARPNPLLLSGLHVQASHVRQRRARPACSWRCIRSHRARCSACRAPSFPSPSTTRPPCWIAAASNCTIG
ncbi:transcriptional regulator, AraC family domain protein [Mycobacterium intracellulare 1956]|uniref:Transcriptional regulator, AraC family domain protein n=1 Tax=Mycobacterium intracellulare 1956 TaxID=1299331 RepID=X8CRI8_MYCIT|nr:transcriptional regulator, AraC family domain protein [Mycobacterium intracellulare 1956]